MPERRKRSLCESGSGGLKDFHDAAMLLVVAITTLRADQGLLGRVGRFLLRRGMKMGERRMCTGMREWGREWDLLIEK